MSEQKPLHMVLHTMDAPNQEVTDMPTTLEAFHTEKMRTMNDKRAQISSLETKIEEKEAQIDEFAGALHSDEYKVMVEDSQEKIASGHHVTSKKPASKLRTPQNSVLN